MNLNSDERRMLQKAQEAGKSNGEISIFETDNRGLGTANSLKKKGLVALVRIPNEPFVRCKITPLGERTIVKETRMQSLKERLKHIEEGDEEPFPNEDEDYD